MFFVQNDGNAVFEIRQNFRCWEGTTATGPHAPWRKYKLTYLGPHPSEPEPSDSKQFHPAATHNHKINP